jgi:hypothetical protein
MNREVHVRLREGLRGKFPRSTRFTGQTKSVILSSDYKVT